MYTSHATAPPLRMIVAVHPRAWIGTLQQAGHRVGATPSTTPSFLSLSLLVSAFVVSLLLAVGASAWFTRRLETISDLFDLSPGLLSLLGALGANIPNYVASLVATASGQLVVGLGIILGSNIYNMAIILGISTFASKTRQGIAFTRKAAQDVRVVAASTLSIMLTTLLAVGLLSWRAGGATLPLSIPVTVVLLTTNLLSLGLFCMLAFHSLRRVPHEHAVTAGATALIDAGDPLPAGNRRMAVTRPLVEAVLALVLALGGVIVMVQTGQAFAVDVHLSQAILGLVILAVATSLPNTVVAFTLARTDRASACLEEVLSSNSINATLGIALPLLLWQHVPPGPLPLFPDALLMVALTLTALIGAFRQRVSRLTGFLLVLVYVSWVVVHAFA
jgi:cation:H+ antiporter